MARMLATVEELDDNRVRLRVEVPEHDVQHAVEHAATDLADQVKVPGFRKGKVPRQVLLARVGKDRVYREAVESHIGGWFWNAAARTRLRPIEQPRYGYELPTTDRGPFEFTAEFAVQPKPVLPEWSTLEVAYPRTELPDGIVDHELDVLRSSGAELRPVEDRPAREGDTVVVDLENVGGESQRDYVVEIGSHRVVDEIEEALVGMSAGETKQIEFEGADESKAGVEMTVKEIKEKVLLPLDDELARATSEFDSLADLRSDIEHRLQEQLEDEAETAFRAAVVDRLVEASGVEAAGPLVESRTRELVAGLVRSVERRGLSFENYLALTGADPNEVVERLRAEAAHSVARELVLEAVAERLGIEISDDEVSELVREQAEAAGDDPEATVEQVMSSGVAERLREDLRLRAALDRVASEVKQVSPDREAIWTPDKEKPETPSKIWTPGSKE
jgi:trigger factor